MPYFLETVETIDDGLGFAHFDVLHLAWLAFAVILVLVNAVLYRSLGLRGRNIWRKAIGGLLLADEVLKFSVLFVGGNYLSTYLPLHLCSINVFIIAWHCIRPNKTIGNFLYMVCIPGALAALLFPTWTALPLTSGMHIHSFTAHIMLLMYPIVLFVNGEFDIKLRYVPRSFLILLVMAAIIYPINLILDTNFMFLMYADPGNPLYWFGANWGSHLLGFPVIIAGVLIVLYMPLELSRKLKHNKSW